MPRQNNNSRGLVFAQRFNQARRELRRAPCDGARDLPLLAGLHPNGTANVPMENIYAEATNILVCSGEVFLQGENVVLETRSGGSFTLQLLTTGCDLMSSTPAMLANYLTCQTGAGSESPTYFSPQRNLVANLLARGPTRDALPRIVTYARRPVYDEHFVRCGPGYHQQQEILVHGFDVEPTLPTDVDDSRPISDRLPPHIRTLFSGFCFRDPADVANGLAALLTGVLSNHFVRHSKATINIDANQAGVGKTLFALVTGAVLDGEFPNLIHFTADDEELAKRTLANLRQRRASVLVFDNAKNRGGLEISSPFIEANSVSPNVTLRILGKSANYSQPNDLLWFITMNQTKISPDLASRGMPIRLWYEGNPAQRVFDGPSPLDYAMVRRGEILGELFGLVEHWNSHGRPMGGRQHRCSHWAQIVGGILEVCGFPEFLGNAADAAAEFNTELGDLAALAETVVQTNNSVAYTVVAHQRM